MIGSWPDLRGVRVYNFSVVPALFTVYLLHELKIPEKRGFGKAGEERKCQRTAEVTDPPLAVAAWES